MVHEEFDLPQYQEIQEAFLREILARSKSLAAMDIASKILDKENCKLGARAKPVARLAQNKSKKKEDRCARSVKYFCGS